MFVALFATLTMSAQQIAVVSGQGVTTVYDGINEAINGAEEGSTIYLNAGGHILSADTKVTKRLTIMGSGHKVNTENADGNTLISGDLNLAKGSDGTAIIGVYMTQGIKIGVDGQVSDIMVQYCNVDNIQVKTLNCPGIYVNQTYVRSEMQFSSSNARVSNCIINNLYGATGGDISHCVISGGINTNNTSFSWNLRWNGIGGDRNVSVSDVQGDFSSIITKWDGISIYSDFHYVEGYEGDTRIGIYGGTGFDDTCTPPIPYIVSKRVPEQTDAQGNLSVEVNVKSK